MSNGIVAIIGKPNVGKSTFFNYLIGERKAIVGDTPGMTRDRIYGETTWRERTFTIIDTGGIEEKSNEIPTIPEILKRFNVKGNIITWDALNSQIENVKVVVQLKGDYVIPIKGNQNNFYNDLKEYFDEGKYEELKESENLIYKALEIVSTLFESDLDKGGMPYMLHIVYVYRHVSSIDEKVVALLHDVIEDKKVTKEDLIEIGFPSKIVEDVSILTRDKKVDYDNYIDNIIKHGSREALNVKLADLENNMDITRIKNPTVKDYQRVEKRYVPTHEKIINRLKEIN